MRIVRPGSWPEFPRCAAAGDYAGALRGAILAYKERRHRVWGRVLGRLLADAVAEVAGGTGPVRLVPVPSSGAAVRARGIDHVRTLAGHAADQLRRSGRVAEVCPVLAVARRTGDSVGLSAAERSANVAGAFRAAGRPAGSATLVLVDDVVTTGATLGEAARTLAGAGLPAAAAVVAATPRRGRRSG